MKSVQLLFLFACLLSSITLTQAQDTTATKRRNELAVDVAPVFAGIVSNTGIPGITYRRHYSNGALRMRFNINGDSQSNRQINTYVTNANLEYPTSNFGTSVRIGYQWHRDWSKWRWYYGVDGVFAYSTSRDQQEHAMTSPDPTESINIQRQKYNTIYRGTGISPIIGFTYRLSDRFSISAESSLNLLYTYAKTSHATSYVSRDISSGRETPAGNAYETARETKGFSYSFVPLNGLLVSYHF